MKVAVQGCCHGELDLIYDVLQRVAEENGEKVDLLLCCGDFQAVRNSEDLNSMSVPNKHKKMGCFYKYYSGEKSAPVLTIFIGGNHEASNHLRELGFGGWVAPNIYYLGHSGVVCYGGLRIGGISGIYKFHDYNKGHYESPPYNPGTLRSTYHIRSCDVFKLKQITGDVDIMMSHDWPAGIHRHGNYDQLFKIKPYFRAETFLSRNYSGTLYCGHHWDSLNCPDFRGVLISEAERDELGSPPAMELLQYLCPSYWFSAHLHCKFAAAYRHDNGITKFLALDKCLPRGGYLQILDVPSQPAPYKLEYDPQWLSILKATESVMPYTSKSWFPPGQSSAKEAIQKCSQEISKSFHKDYTIPHNFKITVPPHAHQSRVDFRAVPKDIENFQTAHFCGKLGIKNPWYSGVSLLQSTQFVSNPEEISLDFSDDENEEDSVSDSTGPVTSFTATGKLTDVEHKPTLLPTDDANKTTDNVVNNPDEICLSDETSDS